LDTWLLAIVLACWVLLQGIGIHLKPLGDGFIKLIRMVVTPIIFTMSSSASPECRASSASDASV
jgi:Na+/H+-dicarboxylate symporter